MDRHLLLCVLNFFVYCVKLKKKLKLKNIIKQKISLNTLFVSENLFFSSIIVSVKI